MVCAVVVNFVLNITWCGSLAPLWRGSLCRRIYGDLCFLLSQVSVALLLASSDAPLNSQPPVVSIVGSRFPAVYDDVRHLHVTLAGVLAVEIRTTGRP